MVTPERFELALHGSGHCLYLNYITTTINGQSEFRCSAVARDIGSKDVALSTLPDFQIELGW